MSAALTTSELRDFEALEVIVHAGIDTFVEVGLALAEIRDRGLYRHSHDTFEGYCRERWELGRTRAYQLISAAAVNDAMSTMVDTSPMNERQARELAPLKDDEQAMVEVWRDLRGRHGDKLTAQLVKVEVDQRLARRSKVACPGCERLVLADRIDDPDRRLKPGWCDRCGNKLSEEKSVTTEFSIDSERKGQLAKSAAKRFWEVVGRRGGLPIDNGQSLHDLIHLERALAVVTDEEISSAITSLEKGIAETKVFVAELRRYRGRS